MNIRTISLQLTIFTFILAACQPAPTATRVMPTITTPAATATQTATATPTPIICKTQDGSSKNQGNPNIQGWASAGPVLVGAFIRLYTLEPNGKLTPVRMSKDVCTDAEGLFQTPVLPEELNYKVLVIEASDGNLMDNETKQTFSFTSHRLRSIVEIIDFNRSFKYAITPFTEMAFRLTISRLTASPTVNPVDQSISIEIKIASLFDLNGYDNNMDGMRLINITYYRPNENGSTTQLVYDRRLDALFKQAVDSGVPPVDWLEQLIHDADDGELDGPVIKSAQTMTAPTATPIP